MNFKRKLYDMLKFDADIKGVHLRNLYSRFYSQSDFAALAKPFAKMRNAKILCVYNNTFRLMILYRTISKCASYNNEH